MSDTDADQPPSQLATYARQRDDLLVHIVGVLHADLPVLVQPEMKSNAQPGAHFQLVVFDRPLEVDWNIGPLSQASRPATSRIPCQRAEVAVMAQPPLSPTERLAWLDHQLTFFWAMAPVAVKYIGRAQSRCAVDQLGLLTGALLSLSRPLADANEPDPVMQLVTRGTITLDTPLSTYLPRPYIPDDALFERVTARHVLSHVTGWPNWRPTGQDLRRNAPPGERFGYSGEGYVYLQRVVEHVTGRSLEELMQTDVLTPLGMLRSTFDWARPEDPAIAAAHDRDGAPIAPYLGEHANAASSLHATPTDFASFMITFLTQPQGMRDEMMQPQVRVNENIAWGLGWGLQVSGQGRAFWHWGDNPGYKSFALALRDARKGVVVMTNGDGGRPLCAWIVQRVLGADHPALGWLDRL
jgi:hypothetical protein